MVYMPALWLYSLGDIMRKLFNCCRKTFFPMVSSMISVSLHPYWCNHFAIDQEMGISGIALAGLITHGTTLVFMMFFHFFEPLMRQTWVKYDKRTFEDVGQYLEISWPFVVTMCLDFWSYDLMTAMSGVIGVES